MLVLVCLQKSYVFLIYSQGILTTIPSTFLRQFLTASYQCLNLCLPIFEVHFGHNFQTNQPHQFFSEFEKMEK